MENTNLTKTEKIEKTDEKITTTQSISKETNQTVIPKDSQLELPKDPTVLTNCIKNILVSILIYGFVLQDVLLPHI